MTKPPSSPCDSGHTPEVTITSVLCRICYDGDKSEALIAPCRCKGTIAFVHRSCLQKWLAESNTTACELCHSVYRTNRSCSWRLLQNQRTPADIARGLRSNIIACLVITPAAIIITYVCLFSLDYYKEEKFVLVSDTHWASVSLLIIIGILLLGYYLWVYSVIRTHSRMWRHFWQRDYVVRYIPSTDTHICYHNVTERVNLSNAPISTYLSLDLAPVGNSEENRSTQGIETEINETNERQSEERVDRTVINIPENENKGDERKETND